MATDCHRTQSVSDSEAQTDTLTCYTSRATASAAHTGAHANFADVGMLTRCAKLEPLVAQQVANARQGSAGRHARSLRGARTGRAHDRATYGLSLGLELFRRQPLTSTTCQRSETLLRHTSPPRCQTPTHPAVCHSGLRQLVENNTAASAVFPESSRVAANAATPERWDSTRARQLCHGRPCDNAPMHSKAERLRGFRVWPSSLASDRNSANVSAVCCWKPTT